MPDASNWAGLFIGLGASLTAGVPGFKDAVLGAATGFALLYAVGVVGRWLFKEEAMGGGDIKMMAMVGAFVGWKGVLLTDRKSTRLNSSHSQISYAVFCLQKKSTQRRD